MEYFEKKITYLRGLCDGSDFPAESKEGKIFHGILDVLDDMAFMLETFMDDEDLVMEDEDLDEGFVWIYISYLRQKLKAIHADLAILGEEGGSFTLVPLEGDSHVSEA